jgi:D-glycero-alpha-D-manno-heptose-7-phosphate kinase
MIITQSPLRISFLGGGSDFPEHFRCHGGAVLATAIGRNSYVTVQPFNHAFFDHSLRIAYRRAETPKDASGIENPAIRACFQQLGIDAGIELHHMSDLPARSGLGSSSSFVVAMLQALHAHQGRFKCAEQLAREAIEVERGILGEAGGHQDQIIAAFGGISLIRFSGRADFTVHRIPLTPERIDDLESHIVLAYTCIQRYSHEALNDQPLSVAQKRAVLCELAELAEEGVRVLASDAPVSAFGGLLHRSWQLKRSCGASLPCIDELYEKGLEAGATGGKLLGAGKGGFLLFIVPPDKREPLQQALGGTPLASVKINAPGSRVIFSQS